MIYDKLKTVTTMVLRRKLGAVLDQVRDSGEPVMITRDNRPLVVLVSPERYEQMASGREQRIMRAAERMSEWRTRYLTGARRDPAALVRKDRDSR